MVEATPARPQTPQDGAHFIKELPPHSSGRKRLYRMVASKDHARGVSLIFRHTPGSIALAQLELSQLADWRVTKAMLGVIPSLGRAHARRLPRCVSGCTLGVGQYDAADDVWIGGEFALVYLARECFEANALCALETGIFIDQVNMQDCNGYSAMHFAALNGHSKLLEALLAHGGDPSQHVQDAAYVSRLDEASTYAPMAPGGRGALHFAAVNGDVRCIQILLECGCNPTEVDWQGHTPLTIAQYHNNVAATALLGHKGVAMQQEIGIPLQQGLIAAYTSAIRTRARERLSIKSRPLLLTPFVMTSTWSENTCKAIIVAAECAAHKHSWQTNRHQWAATMDIPACDLATYGMIRRTLEQVILPEMQRRYDTCELCVREAFVIKYEGGAERGDTPSRAGLHLHRDGTLLNVVILLSDPRSFDGGGTVFDEPVSNTFHTLQGDCLCSCGQVHVGNVEPYSRSVQMYITCLGSCLRSPWLFFLCP